MQEVEIFTILLGLFAIGIVVILLEAYMGFPFGKVRSPFVFCLIPPFIKRFRIFGYWIGFDSNWKFLWLKKEEKGIKMKAETKALLTILIHEVQSELLKGNQAVNDLLDTWIKANDLQINEVQTMTQEEFRKFRQELNEQSWFYKVKKRLPNFKRRRD